MNPDVIKSLFIAFGIACVGEVLVYFSHSTLVVQFLKANIVSLQIGLLAINTATLGIVLTKVRELISKGASAAAFSNTRRQMLLSIKEQVALLAAALVVLTLGSSPEFMTVVPVFVPDALLITCFVYSVMILYDTAVSIFVILDAPG